MPREHRITHPTLGPVSWDQLRWHVIVLRKEQARKACWWCFGEVPAGFRTRCGSENCKAMIERLVYWSTCVRDAFRADNWLCRLCKGRADECDHIIPVSLGGTGDPDNLRALCAACHKIETARLRKLGPAYVAKVA